MADDDKPVKRPDEDSAVAMSSENSDAQVHAEILSWLQSQVPGIHKHSERERTSTSTGSSQLSGEKET